MVMLAIVFWNLGNAADIYDPAWMTAAYQKSTLAFWAYYVLGILASILTLLVALSLQERMHAKAPNLMRLAVMAVSAYAALFTTTMIGGFFRNLLLMDMNDMSAFRTFLVLHEFLGNSAISILGWGFLLFGWAALAARALPRVLSGVMFLYGIVSIIQFAFTASKSQLGAGIHEMLFLIVFTWLGIALLRKPE
jgi:hypothetical protein